MGGRKEGEAASAEEVMTEMRYDTYGTVPGPGGRGKLTRDSGREIMGRSNQMGWQDEKICVDRNPRLTMLDWKPRRTGIYISQYAIHPLEVN